MSPTIRLATPADAERVQSIYAPFCATPISFEMTPPSVEEMQQRIVKILERCPWLVAEEKAAILGYAYASQHRERAAYNWSVDVSVYVDSGRHRCGLGRALYSALFGILQLQGFVNVYAGATLPNPASVGLHRAMGFQPVGTYRHVGFKYDVWHDVAWFELLLQPLPKCPSPIKPIAEVCQSQEWASMQQGFLV